MSTLNKAHYDLDVDWIQKWWTNYERFCIFPPFQFSMVNLVEPFLNSKKTYEYKYEGLVRVGREMPDLVESALKMRCTFNIIGESPQTFVLQVTNTVPPILSMFRSFYLFPSLETS